MQRNLAIVFGFVAAGAIVGLPSGADATKGYTVLHDFCPQGEPCSDGIGPAAGLISDSAGNLYGTTAYGGTCTQMTAGCGTIFKVAPDGTESVLYSFCQQLNCADGQHPVASLLRDNLGNLYGTTEEGGANGRGTVFTVKSDGTFQVFYSFCTSSGCADGAQPMAPVVIDKKGNLYGTTESGGLGYEGYGVLFRVNGKGKETVLRTFDQDSYDGGNPMAGLIRDDHGNMYGTTYSLGEYGFGTVFEFTATGAYNVLYQFCPGGYPCADGGDPAAPLILDATGNLYGTTKYGGAANQGTVFKISPDGIETVLYSFCSQSGCTDGEAPLAGLTAVDGGNALVGTTESGGTDGSGVVFQITNGQESVLHSFNFSDGTGTSPVAPVIKLNKWFYGTASFGGGGNGGVVFRLGTKGD